jgi:hypothetical protein
MCGRRKPAFGLCGWVRFKSAETKKTCRIPPSYFINLAMVTDSNVIMPATTATPSFLPKADAAILTFRHQAPPQQARPTTIGPILDPENHDKPISVLTPEIEATFYPTPDPNAPTSTICDAPSGFNDRYLRAYLADNERLRLSMLWYYTRGIEEETELLAGLQEKADLAKECTGWQFSVVGILDFDVYIRLATHGLQLGILPRGETLCAHTVTQPPGVSCRLEFSKGISAEHPI